MTRTTFRELAAQTADLIRDRPGLTAYEIRRAMGLTHRHAKNVMAWLACRRLIFGDGGKVYHISHGPVRVAVEEVKPIVGGVCVRVANFNSRARFV